MIYLFPFYVKANNAETRFDIKNFRRESDGRIDMVVETNCYVYVMEFKVDGSAQEAIDQINSKEYSLPWSVDHRKVIKIGANYSTTSRRLTDYIIE